MPQVLRGIDANGDGELDWEEFKHVHATYPSAFYPVVRMQRALMERVMGLPWWERKRRLFNDIREALVEERARVRALAGEARAQRRNVRAEQVGGSCAASCLLRASTCQPLQLSC